MILEEACSILGVRGARQNYNETYEFVKYLENKPISTIVEIGMGTGGVCGLFKKTFPYSKVVGVDILPTDHTMIDFARNVGIDYIIGLKKHKNVIRTTRNSQRGNNKI